jgi:putative ubiquitin-RnfH superfamily antitoxin RatB of RatAB toxin-antitoxin module
MDKPLLRIEVAYALREEQVLLELEMAEGTTARQAVERSGILQRIPEIDLARAGLGIFGRVVAPDTPLRDGDRVEIYRPLIADPKPAPVTVLERVHPTTPALHATPPYRRRGAVLNNPLLPESAPGFSPPARG